MSFPRGHPPPFGRRIRGTGPGPRPSPCGETFGQCGPRQGATVRVDGTTFVGVKAAALPVTPISVTHRDEAAALEGGPVVIGTLLRPVGQLHLLPGSLAVGDLLQDVVDDVEAGPLLFIGWNDEPRALLSVLRWEHRVACPRVVVPPLPGREVGLAQLPLSQRVFDSRLEAPCLLLVADLQPVLEEDDLRFQEGALVPGHDLQEAVP